MGNSSQDPINWLDSPDQIFGEEREKANNEVKILLQAWEMVGTRVEGERIKNWLLKQILKPLGPQHNGSHAYYSGTQDAFKLIYDLINNKKEI